jgi:signal transduction histidine kinase
MRTAMDVVLAKPEPTCDELVSMTADVRQAVDHAERLIEALLVLARNDQARTLTDPLDLAAVAEDTLEGRNANGITTTTTLDEAPVTGDGVLLERLVNNLLDNVLFGAYLGIRIPSRQDSQRPVETAPHPAAGPAIRSIPRVR